MSETTFHLGITMAGAVSAGCYTGGAMDYLIEMLDFWYQQKENPSPELKGLVPPHDVIIDAIGGASAGGMTSSMSIIELLKKERFPMNDPQKKDRAQDNTFYKSWVNMDDDPQARTLEKMLQTDDLQNSVPSLLNSKSIDRIAEKAFPKEGNLEEALQSLPKYVAPDMELILSLSMLNGIPLEVDFRTPITRDEPAGGDTPRHATWEHFTLGHFKLGSGQEPGYKWLNPFDQNLRKTFLKTTIATGAFPIGLASRYFDSKDFDDEYIKDIAERIVFGRFGDDEDKYETDQIVDEIKARISTSKIPIQHRSVLLRNCEKLPSGAYHFYGTLQGAYREIPAILLNDIRKLLRQLPHFIDWTNFKENFAFTAVDGGTINNEPYGEILGILKGRVKKDTLPQKEEQDANKNKKPHKNYGVVMIDPFPDIAKNRSEAQNEFISEIGGVAGALVGALINQSRVKRHEIVQELNDPSVKGVIFPMKWSVKLDYLEGQRDRPFVKSKERRPFPIACESLRAFGGFMDERFREHDFFLGRNNARSFFRYFFSLPYDEENPNPLFKDWTNDMIDTYGVRRNGKLFLPIVPDLKVALEKKTSTEEEFSVSQYRYQIEDLPKIKVQEVLDLEDKIKARIEALIKALSASKERKDYPFKNLPISESIVKKKYYSGWFGRIKNGKFEAAFMDTKTKALTPLLVRIASKQGAKRLTKKVLILMLKDLESKGLLEE
jgi:hypothetical protein